MLDFIFGFFSHDIGIDLGTANTLVHVKDKGIVIREPSVVALHKKTKDVLAIGSAAKEMLGKTPASIIAVRPLKDGVISDFEVAEKMLAYFIKKVHESHSIIPKIPRPRVIVGIPSGVTEVERKAVVDAAKGAGARQAFLIEEPMAAAIGAGLPINEPAGSMIVDMGGGTTEIAVISLGGIVINKSVRVAGDEIDQDIINYSRQRFNLLVGERTAEAVKIAIGSAFEGFSGESFLRGRDLKTGLPKAVKVSAEEIREAVSPSLKIITAAIKDAVEETPPELISDVMSRGITLAGGTSQLRGLAKHLNRELNIPVTVAEDPMTCVVKGAAASLDNLDLLEKVKVS